MKLKITTHNIKKMANSINNRISKSDFNFLKVGYGRWEVTYTSPVTGKEWRTETTDTRIVDDILHEDEPTQRRMNEVKKFVKTYGFQEA